MAKLTKTDMVKAVAREMQAAALADVEQCALRVNDCKRGFRHAVVERARRENDAVLSSMADAVGSELDDLIGRTSYRVYLDEQRAQVAQVVFTDHDREYEASCRLVVEVRVDGKLAVLAEAWEDALVQQNEAEKRDTRVSAMTAAAREKVVKDALESCPEGQAALAAFRTFAAVLKDLPE